MVRTIEISGDQIEVKDGQIEVRANIGPGRVVGATLRIDDSGLEPDGSPTDPAKMSFEEWERNFNEMCALAPVNEHPADVSREAMYLSDDELGNMRE